LLTSKIIIMKPFTITPSKMWMLWSVLSILIFSACSKQIDPQATQNESPSEAGKKKANANKVYVSNVGELYQAVNDPANAGSVIVLAAGTYILNASYPNAGRIELLHDMELHGQSGHPATVVIDGSALPDASFVLPGSRTGAIRMGRGFNSIEWLTVLGNATNSALSVIDTDLPSTGLVTIRIAHTIVTGGRIGVDIRNTGAASAGRIIEAEIVNNELKENLVQFGQGIIVQNSNGATGAIIRANLQGNNVHGNKVGLRAFNINNDSGGIYIRSVSDRFDENGIGLIVNAGDINNSSPSNKANGNYLEFEAHGTSVQNNKGTLLPNTPPPGGIFTSAGNSLLANRTSDNRLIMTLWGCPVSDNHEPGINAFGARSTSGAPAGTNNVAVIHLHGLSKQTTVQATPSFPAEPAGTNVVKVFK
jgi:hypothetical protein